MGFALECVGLDDLQKPGWYYTYYESVTFEAWGTLEIDVTGKGRHHVRWDTRHARSWHNYQKAREKLYRTPIPYGVARATHKTKMGDDVWVSLNSSPRCG
jgi:hypothetical protein